MFLFFEQGDEAAEFLRGFLSAGRIYLMYGNDGGNAANAMFKTAVIKPDKHTGQTD